MTYKFFFDATISRTVRKISSRMRALNVSMSGQLFSSRRITASVTLAKGSAPMFGISMPRPGMMNSQQAAMA